MTCLRESISDAGLLDRYFSTSALSYYLSVATHIEVHETIQRPQC